MPGRKLVSRVFKSERWRETALHAHRNGQFTFVRRGLVSLETESGVWVVPPGRLAWIPPRLRHASRSRGPVEGWLVLAAPSYARHLPKEVSVLKAQPLLIAALDRIGQTNGGRTVAGDGALERALDDLVLLEVAGCEAEYVGIPLPASPSLRAWAGRFLDAPDAKASIDAGATTAGMSRRSFTRHFEQETGRTFSDWKRLVMVQHAIERLANGERVAAIAFDLGYENPSAFIAMFKATKGMPPRQFIGSAGERA